MDRAVTVERMDEDIHQEVTLALWKVPTVRTTNPPLVIEVKSGVVTISGVVRSRTISQQIHAVAASVDGVNEVHTNLENDVSIELAVAQTLAADEQVRRWSPRIWVSAYYGTVRLQGPVPDRRIVERAGELASSVAGVRQIVNELT